MARPPAASARPAALDPEPRRCHLDRRLRRQQPGQLDPGPVRAADHPRVQRHLRQAHAHPGRLRPDHRLHGQQLGQPRVQSPAPSSASSAWSTTARTGRSPGSTPWATVTTHAFDGRNRLTSCPVAVGRRRQLRLQRQPDRRDQPAGLHHHAELQRRGQPQLGGQRRRGADELSWDGTTA